MPPSISTRPSGCTGKPVCATIRVAEPGHLCRVQSTTRKLCRSVGMDEAAVFQAVIAVTELAHRHFVERTRCGDIELSAVRRRRELGLEVRAESADVRESPSARVSLTFPRAAAFPYS